MGELSKRTIYTIGHSTRSLEELIALLNASGIHMLADIRTFPGSKRYPHFNKDALALSLPESGIAYIHIPQLGGRRKPKQESKNTVWKNAAFRGYADHMESGEFKEGISTLEALAEKEPTVYMCSEAVWWRCHRALVSDYLKSQGWEVLHIMAEGVVKEHPYTGPAREAQGKLF